MQGQKGVTEFAPLSDPKAPIAIHQDASVRVCELDVGATAALPVAPGRQVYLVCVEGAINATAGAEKAALAELDCLEAYSGAELVLEGADCGAHFVAIDVAAPPSTS